MKVVLVDTGRGRSETTVEQWRAQVELTDTDELALISWNHPRVALPVVDQLVFGPRLDWSRPEPVRPNVTLARRVPAEPPLRASTADLPWTDSRRIVAAAQWRLRRLNRALTPLYRRIPGPLNSPLDLVSSTSPVGTAIRRRLGVASDGVATDFALAVARSAQAAELAAWADVLVPVDARSRKAAWVLARRVPGPAVPSEMSAAARIIRATRP